MKAIARPLEFSIEIDGIEFGVLTYNKESVSRLADRINKGEILMGAFVKSRSVVIEKKEHRHIFYEYDPCILFLEGMELVSLKPSNGGECLSIQNKVDRIVSEISEMKKAVFAMRCAAS